MAVQGYTDKVLISRLTDITEANLTDEHFGVNTLTEQAGISHSQLHRKLKACTNQSASQFIREIRLLKSKEMLELEMYTIAEIAYKVGFSSPSYFNKCFHSYFGHPPGEYKKHEHKNQKIDSTNIRYQAIADESIVKSNNLKQNKKSNKKSLVFIFGVLLLIPLTFFTYKYFNELTGTNTVIVDKSIAVLPLKDLSKDGDNQYLADGIMADILNRISQIHDLKVKSRISVDIYNNTSATLAQIAKDLNVSYILEGSILKKDDRVKIYVRLIDVKKDTPIWSDQYDHDLSNIFTFVSDVSKQVAEELRTVLSPDELKYIDKAYTKNIEAYNLYLEARFYWQLRGEENLWKSIEYYKKALAIDSNYSLAYAGLADSYIILSWFKHYPKEKSITLSKGYIAKALSLDNNLAEAHSTLGLIATYFEYDWNTAEHEFKRAIKINPNYATAHQWYSEYLDIIGHEDLARKHINRALEIKPHCTIMLWQSYYYWLMSENYKNALETSNKIFSINNNKEKHAWNNFNIYIRQKDSLKAIEEIKQYLSQISPETQVSIIDSIYAKSQTKGIINYIINVRSEKAETNDFWKARLYSVSGQYNNAIKHLERAYNKDNSSGLVRLKYEADFIPLRKDPRFISLLEKLNLGSY